MKDIYVVVKEINSRLQVLSASFDEDEAIIKADMIPMDFSNGQVDIIENSVCGRIAVMTLYEDTYKDFLDEAEVDSIFEINNLVEIVDYSGEAREILINRIMEELEDSEYKTEWEICLGLNKDNDSEDMFNIDSMITNK